LMHELGHLVLHQASSIDDAADFQSNEGHEREANLFAGHLLVPAEFLLEINDQERPPGVEEYDDWLKPQSEKWTVSTEVILRRLMDSGRLTKQKYSDYRAWRDNQAHPDDAGGTRLYRHKEAVHIFGDGYVRTVLDSLSGKRITLARASSYLDNLKISDLHQLERYYAHP
jgi:Zn-dependent peptidase ImmA (M78 family)